MKRTLPLKRMGEWSWSPIENFSYQNPEGEDQVFLDLTHEDWVALGRPDEITITITAEVEQDERT